MTPQEINAKALELAIKMYNKWQHHQAFMHKEIKNHEKKSNVK